MAPEALEFLPELSVGLSLNGLLVAAGLHRPAADQLVHCRHELAGWLHESRCDEVVRGRLEAGRPLVAWLGKHVGPAAARPRPG